MNRIVFRYLFMACAISLSGLIGCAQNPRNDMETKKDVNPLICDPTEGVCEVPGHKGSHQGQDIEVIEKPIKIIYYTDPICSSCWGIEPQLRKLKLEYGSQFEIEYRMGGLLKDWSYNSGGISEPADVASHWDEVSIHYDMPIDGDVWLEDPLESSYPSSIAFKAAQIQDKDKAVVFLRKLREMLFLEKKNIDHWKYVNDAAAYADLDAEQLRNDYEGQANELFEEDLKLGRQLGVRGFPSVFMMNQHKEREFVYGSRPYSMYRSALEKLLPDLIRKDYQQSLEALFRVYPTMTVREFAELADMERQNALADLEENVAKGILSKFTTKNGDLYSIK